MGRKCWWVHGFFFSCEHLTYPLFVHKYQQIPQIWCQPQFVTHHCHPPHVLFGLFGQQHPLQLSPFHTLSSFLSFIHSFFCLASNLVLCTSVTPRPKSLWVNQHLLLHSYHGRNPKNKFGLLVNMVNIWSSLQRLRPAVERSGGQRNLEARIWGNFEHFRPIVWLSRY